MAAAEKRKRLSRLPASPQTVGNGGTLLFSTQNGTRDATGLGGEAWVEGSILRITMHNFLTYDHCEVRPGENLNMIVGANGTGKSSIVCAICLALAGKPATLGRGDKVGLYVKRGCMMGSVEVELYQSTRNNLVLHREIHVENNQSVWTVNGRQTSQREVEEKVKALHIQVNNLCQFLPQEKVGEFAKMSKVELLEATEKSVGPKEMYELHCELKSFRTKEREQENQCKDKERFLEKAKQSNERVKQDVDRYYERKRHLDMIKMLEQKKQFVEYEMLRKQHEEVKQEWNQVKHDLKTLKERQAPMLQKLQAIHGQLKPIESGMKEKAAEIKEVAEKCKRSQDLLDGKNKEKEDIQQQLKLKQTEEADRQKRISTTYCVIQDLQAQRDSLENMVGMQQRIDGINGELRQLQEQKNQMESKRSALRHERDTHMGETRILENKLRNVDDLMKRKEDKLRQRSRDTYSALQWLRENKQIFTGSVHEPIMLVISVQEAQYAKYIESHIPFNDLRAFVFQKQVDMETFMTEVRDKQKLRVNAVIAPSESFSRCNPSRPIEELRHFGFISYLRELFDAPEEVMSYLCHQYKVHEVPVGTQDTKSMIEVVIQESNLRIIYTADEKYNVKKSSYSKKTITSNSALKPSQFLTVAVDVEEKKQLQTKLEALNKKMKETDVLLKEQQEQQSHLDHRDNELRSTKKELCEMLGKKRQLDQRISTKKDSLRQMEESGINLHQAEQETKTRTRAVNCQKMSIINEFMQHMQVRPKLHMKKVLLALQSVELLAEKSRLESESHESLAHQKALEQRCVHLEQKRLSLKDMCKQQLQKARQFCKLDPKQNTMPEELQTAFSQLPATLDEIDALLNEEQSRADCFSGLSASVLEEYKRLTHEIEQVTQELEKKKAQLESYRQNISQVKKRWLTPLHELVDEINKKFSEFFRSMQCAGEVDLHADNEEEYDKYGIRIRVKFRSSTQLHELTAHHQSGGERSVSTMLYLMALQELNRCPFRVVDEINQGMDPVNERRVFDIVVRTACKGSTSQYFFITPKLLQNLQYADEMTILCVQNGPYMLNADEWKEKSFLQRARRRADQSTLKC